uniref:riboflavin kinase n=1 Tax=Aegilops tauschii TaxID=37682 RepID=M8CHD2_AEGTA
MAAPKPITRLISHVILDLDGTLLNTDCIVSQVLKPFIVKNGKKWDSKKAHKFVGKTPYEAAAVVLEDYGLPYSTEEFLSLINPMFSEQWGNIKALPGANRLIKHLKSSRVPAALASNSSRSNIESKISCQQGWKEYFSAIVGADEVESGKPSPDIFLEAAKRMNADPSNCLVIEDSVSADEIINSLLDLRPEKWGLPPFNDWIEGTLPIDPWFIGGPVIKGFGRGSKVLGIPTGVYFGWAGLSKRGIYKMVMSIGWNPYFDNTEKTIEPWLLHGFDEDFYGEELRLVIVGYIRPEANFPSLESLIERIHEDGRIAENALDLPEYAKYKESPYLRNPLQEGAATGGNEAEQEFI